MALRNIHVVQYITPLREGGSMPAVSKGDDGRMYVIKFRGAGQGPKALVAELIGCEMARKAGLNVPEIVLAGLDKGYGRTEPDPEIQDLLKFSAGLNLGVEFIERAVSFDPAVDRIDGETASKIVWLDCFLTNVDRTAKNTNMLLRNGKLWLIDFGASLYFHHSWADYKAKAIKPFDLIANHVLLPIADRLEETDRWFHEHLNDEYFRELVGLIPDDWLLADTPFENEEQNRNAYFEFLSDRFHHSSIFVKSAIHERNEII